MPAAELAEAARKRGIDVHVLEAGDDAQGNRARRGRACPRRRAAATARSGRLPPQPSNAGLPFVCVPRGTRNHFARDLGLDPADPIAALDAFDGTERWIDVGRAGDRIFLNNVGIGLYAGLVLERERHHIRHGLLATGRALLRSVSHRPEPLMIGGRAHSRTPRPRVEQLLRARSLLPRPAPPPGRGAAPPLLQFRAPSDRLGVVLGRGVRDRVRREGASRRLRRRAGDADATRRAQDRAAGATRPGAAQARLRAPSRCTRRRARPRESRPARTSGARQRRRRDALRLRSPGPPSRD